MIYKLSEENYHLALNLVHTDYFSLQLKTVLEKTNPGFIYVDNTVKPTCALVYHQGEGGFFFIGKADLTFVKNVDQSIEKIFNNIDHTMEEFEFGGDHISWHTIFEQGFKKRKLESSKQRIYTSVTTQTMDEHPLEEEYQLMEIASALNDETVQGKGLQPFQWLFGLDHPVPHYHWSLSVHHQNAGADSSAAL